MLIDLRRTPFTLQDLIAARARRLKRQEPLPSARDWGTPLKNPRHEFYAQVVAAGHTMKEAYLAAGYSDNPVSVAGNAHKIGARPDVAARISELFEYRRRCGWEDCW